MMLWNRDAYLKLRYIYLPYLLSFLSALTGYTALHWLLAIKFQLVDQNTYLWEYGFPALISVLLVYFVMRKRIRLLIDDEKKRPETCYTILFFSYFLSLAMTQDSLEKACRQLAFVEQLSGIKEYQVNDWFKIADFRKASDTPRCVVTSERSGGKYSRRIIYRMSCLVPVIDKGMEYIPATHPYWFGVTYSKSYPSRQRNKVKESFEIEAEMWIDHRLEYPTTWFLRWSGYGNDRKLYKDLLPPENQLELKDVVFLVPTSTSAEKEEYKSFRNTGLALLGSLLVFWLFIWESPLDYTRLKKTYTI